MQLLLLSLSLTTLCYSGLIETASHTLKLHKGESEILKKIKHKLNRFGHTPSDQDIFWQSTALHEIRSPRKPYVSNITVNTGRFAQEIHDIHAIINENHSHKRNISQEFYTVLLCEIVNRCLNGTPSSPHLFFEEPVTKSLSLEMSYKSDNSSPRTSEWTDYLIHSRSIPDIIADKDESSYYDPSEISSFILDETSEQYN